MPPPPTPTADAGDPPMEARTRRVGRHGRGRDQRRDTTRTATSWWKRNPMRSYRRRACRLSLMTWRKRRLPALHLAADDLCDEAPREAAPLDVGMRAHAADLVPCARRHAFSRHGHQAPVLDDTVVVPELAGPCGERAPAAAARPAPASAARAAPRAARRQTRDRPPEWERPTPSDAWRFRDGHASRQALALTILRHTSARRARKTARARRSRDARRWRTRQWARSRAHTAALRPCRRKTSRARRRELCQMMLSRSSAGARRQDDGIEHGSTARGRARAPRPRCPGSCARVRGCGRPPARRSSFGGRARARSCVRSPTCRPGRGARATPH